LRLGWFFVTVLLCLVATYSLMFIVHSIIILRDAGYEIEPTYATFVFPLMLYYGAYRLWKKARAADKQTEKKL